MFEHVRVTVALVLALPNHHQTRTEADPTSAFSVPAVVGAGMTGVDEERSKGREMETEARRANGLCPCPCLWRARAVYVFVVGEAVC